MCEDPFIGKNDKCKLILHVRIAYNKFITMLSSAKGETIIMGMNEEKLIRLSSKGQVVIPISFRTKFNLQDGDFLEISEDGDHMSLRPIQQKSVSDLAGIIKTDVPFKPVKELRDQIYSDEFFKK